MSANTTYGDPNINPYGNGGPVTYTFTPSGMGICHFQPASMAVFSGATWATVAASKFPYVSATNPGGYNPAVWELDTLAGNGSSIQTGGGVKRSSGFPTTGFKGAKFSLIGSGGDQSHYRCTSPDNGVKISLSTAASTTTLGKGCEVTYISGTKAAFILGSTPTITMEYYDGSTWITIDSYTISVPLLWANVKGVKEYNSEYDFTEDFLAAQLCGAPLMNGLNSSNMTVASSYFFKRNELTNAPSANSGYSSYDDTTLSWITTGTPANGGRFSRDVDGTFVGEWGDLYNGAYTGSGFEMHAFVWTAETFSSTRQFFVRSYDGVLGAENPLYGIFLTVCR